MTAGGGGVRDAFEVGTAAKITDAGPPFASEVDAKPAYCNDLRQLYDPSAEIAYWVLN
jgi:hypothetical protein